MESSGIHPITVDAVRRLSAPQLAAVTALAEIVRHHDDLEVPLNLGEAGSDRAVAHFLARRGTVLVGFASLDDSIEVLGTVAPEERRQGIGRALLDAIRGECRRRRAAELLLVCEERSQPGRVFASAVGGQYRFSEHRMELDRRAFALRVSRRDEQARFVAEDLELASARHEDATDLAALRAIAFDRSDKEAQQELARWLREPSEDLRVARLAGETIGMVRVASFSGDTFVHTLAVMPDRRGRGLGSAILERTVEGLMGNSANRILIEVETENAQALSIYRLCGFREISQYRYYALATANLSVAPPTL
jgi:ribosomal protein S18 acetylase RimI-like enzyme